MILSSFPKIIQEALKTSLKQDYVRVNCVTSAWTRDRIGYSGVTPGHSTRLGNLPPWFSWWSWRIVVDLDGGEVLPHITVCLVSIYKMDANKKAWCTKKILDSRSRVHGVQKSGSIQERGFGFCMMKFSFWWNRRVFSARNTIDWSFMRTFR